MATQFTPAKNDRNGYIDGPLTVVDTNTIGEVTLTRSVAPLQYRGWRYAEGAFIVTAKYPDGKSYRPKKTFKGEMAWADSERLYGDLRLELGRRAEDPRHRLSGFGRVR